jgi:flagellar biosynthesis/type III secretory pathway chaperone
VSNPERCNTVIGEQIRCAEQMLEALARENAALVANDADSLAAATKAKTELVDVLERLEAERRTLVEPHDTRAVESRQRLHESIARCKEQNERNGLLLKARAENVRIALQTLRGGEPTLYGASGRMPARTDARPLGTA